MMGALVLSFSNEKRDDGAIVSHEPPETPNYKRPSAACPVRQTPNYKRAHAGSRAGETPNYKRAEEPVPTASGGARVRRPRPTCR